MKKAIIYLIEFLAIQFIVGGVIQGVYTLVKGEITADASGPLMVVSTVVSNLVIIILFLWTRWTPVSVDYVKTRPWGVAFWTILAALGTLLPSVWLQEVLPELPNLIEGDLTNIINTPGGYLAVAVAAPVAEEVVFRGAILRALLSNGRRPWVAIALSAVFFAVGHLNPAQMPHAFIIGLLLGWIYYRTGSILPGVLFHLVNNTVAYIIERMYPGSDNLTLKDLFGGDERAVMLSVIFSLLILLPSLFQLHLRMRSVAQNSVTE